MIRSRPGRILTSSIKLSRVIFHRLRLLPPSTPLRPVKPALTTPKYPQAVCTSPQGLPCATLAATQCVPQKERAQERLTHRERHYGVGSRCKMVRDKGCPVSRIVSEHPIPRFQVVDLYTVTPAELEGLWHYEAQWWREHLLWD